MITVPLFINQTWLKERRRSLPMNDAGWAFEQTVPDNLAFSPMHPPTKWLIFDARRRRRHFRLTLNVGMLLGSSPANRIPALNGDIARHFRRV